MYCFNLSNLVTLTADAFIQHLTRLGSASSGVDPNGEVISDNDRWRTSGAVRNCRLSTLQKLTHLLKINNLSITGVVKDGDDVSFSNVPQVSHISNVTCVITTSILGLHYLIIDFPDTNIKKHTLHPSICRDRDRETSFAPEGYTRGGGGV